MIQRSKYSIVKGYMKIEIAIKKEEPLSWLSFSAPPFGLEPKTL
jgi:hypothetical protein